MILLSYSSYREISLLKWTHYTPIYGFHMTGQRHSHGWAWEGIGPPSGEPGPGNQNTFFPTKGLYYGQIYSSVSSAVQGVCVRRSRRRRSRMWRSWAGVIAHGLLLWHQLDERPNFIKCCLRCLMVEKLTFNYLATAKCTLPQNLRHLWHCVCDKTCTLYWLVIVPCTGCTCVMTFYFILVGSLLFLIWTNLPRVLKH